MSINKDGWFFEKEAMWPGQRFGLKVKKVVFEGKTKFQHVLIFDSESYGRVLVLDGVIQLTERDEHAYQEMIGHVPLLSHPRPEKVLLVGGGDGGVLREIVKHDCVREIVQCEIDGEVIDLAKEHFAETMATAFGDPRHKLVIDDAAKFVQGEKPTYDVVIVDSSDPVGPAEVLFQDAFYDALRAVLRPGGVICNQGECLWLHLPLIKSVLSHCTATFDEARYFSTMVPTYPSGQIGFFLCRLRGEAGEAAGMKDAETGACAAEDGARGVGPGGAGAAKEEDKTAGAAGAAGAAVPGTPDPDLAAAQVLGAPVRSLGADVEATLKYYSPEVHRASFVLPAFAARGLNEVACAGSSSLQKT